MPTISNPGLFTYDPANPTKYTESCSHAIHQVLYALSQAGYEIRDLSDSLGYVDDEEVWHSYLSDFLPPLCDISHIASLMDDVWGDYNIPN